MEILLNEPNFEDLNKEVRNMIEKALQKKKKDRWQSEEEIKRALEGGNVMKR